MIRTLTTLTLALFLIEGMLHLDHVHKVHEEGYGICDPKCHNEHHHALSHECTKCVTQNHRYSNIRTVYLKEVEKEQLLVTKNHNHAKVFISSSCYSRPPPFLL